MDVPTRRDDEDLRKLARSLPDGMGFLHRADGSWALVGADGWPIDPEDLEEETLVAITAVMFEQIDLEPISLTDTELS
ncbi:hypothetical protein [Nocardia jejuensis]|uniref:hypothetical protein n=1 Tax=Nocardia jejuensis TaxID=328049 RepID=UPI000A8021FA|nr:hypothetical protein [Nocardia jejuensis]